MSRSWVMTQIVVPSSAWSSRSRSRIDAPVARVEVAGRLVGEDEGRPADERPGDRDALALAAGQRARPVRHPVPEPDPFERFAAAARRRAAPASPR